MGYLIDGYKILGKELAAWIEKNRSHIGTGVSVAATLASNVLSTRAGAKSGRMIDAKAEEIGRPLNAKEKVALCWKNHIAPAATAGAACVGAIYSDNQHVKDFNKLATAYVGVRKLYDSTRRATREVLGEKKDLELRDRLNQKRIEEDPEFKKKVASMPPNPDPHIYQRFYEPTSGEIIWSTKDKVENAIKIMKLEMKAMKARARNGFNYRGKYGIKLTRFFDLADWNLADEKLNSKVMQFGWNKGCAEDGSEDDDIGATFSPMFINDEKETAIAINWNVEPSDMSYGDYMKS